MLILGVLMSRMLIPLNICKYTCNLFESCNWSNFILNWRLELWLGNNYRVYASSKIVYVGIIIKTVVAKSFVLEAIDIDEDNMCIEIALIE